MAHIEGGGNGRKVSFEPNLVPFIDLMSVLITFLLITAVWSQVSMIQIGSSLYGKKNPNEATPKIEQDMDLVLKLEVKPTGYHLTVGKVETTIPLANGDFDNMTLMLNLQKVKDDHPEKKDAVIMMADELPYENLIKSMDIFLKAGFPAISVATGGPN